MIFGQTSEFENSLNFITPIMAHHEFQTPPPLVNPWPCTLMRCSRLAHTPTMAKRRMEHHQPK